MVFNRWDDDDELYHEYGEIYGERYDDYDTQYRTNLARPFAALSLVGSIYILYDILRKRFTRRPAGDDNNNSASIRNNNNKRSMKMCNKIMVGLSVSDVITSTMYLLGTVPVPKGQAWGAYGTRATCTAQGFFIWYFNPCARLHTATLSLCYVFMVRYTWTEDRLLKIQPFFLGFPHLIAILVALPLLIDQSYNFDQVSVCGPSTYPTWCNRYATEEDEGEVVCTRGGNLSVGGTKFGTTAFKIMAPIDIYLAGIILMVCMGVLYWTVRARERRNQRYDFHSRMARDASRGGPQSSSTPSSTSSNSWSLSVRRRNQLLQQSQRQQRRPMQSTMVGVQGLFYCVAYWCANGPFFVSMTIFWFGLVDWSKRPDWFSPLIVVTLPSQGLFNALVYLRPRVMEWFRKRQRERERQAQRQQDRAEASGDEDPDAVSPEPISSNDKMTPDVKSFFFQRNSSSGASPNHHNTHNSSSVDAPQSVISIDDDDGGCMDCNLNTGKLEESKKKGSEAALATNVVNVTTADSRDASINDPLSHNSDSDMEASA